MPTSVYPTVPINPLLNDNKLKLGLFSINGRGIGMTNHPDKFNPLGGEKVAFDPAANIMVGARILKEYIRRTGDVADALQMYVGASTVENENGYSAKVMAERDRLRLVLKQYLTRNPGPEPQATVANQYAGRAEVDCGSSPQ